MTQLIIDDDLAETIRSIAQVEAKSLNDIMRKMIALYRTQMPVLSQDEHRAQIEARCKLAGKYKDNVTDLSTTVDQTLDTYFRENHVDTD